MKQIAIIICVLMLFAATGCSSGHYVSAPPQRVMVARPAPPYANSVWIDGGYHWRGGRYVYRPGYWAAPQRRVRVYTPGAWISTPRGYYWRRGGWR